MTLNRKKIFPRVGSRGVKRENKDVQAKKVHCAMVVLDFLGTSQILEKYI